MASPVASALEGEGTASRRRKLAAALLALVVGVGLSVRSLLSRPDGKPIAPIFDAVAAGNVEAVRSAVAASGALSATDPDGNTPLHKAVLGNWPEVVKTLLASGAPTEASNHEGYTPLGYAVLVREWDSSEAVKALVAGGADVTVAFPSGEPLIHEVVKARRGNDPVLKALLTAAPRAALASKNRAGKSLADVASAAGNGRALELIGSSPRAAQ